MEFIRIYCQEKNCPYHKKTGCCLCEVDAESVKKDPNLVTRNKCKQKNSLIVYGRPAA